MKSKLKSNRLRLIIIVLILIVVVIYIYILNNSNHSTQYNAPFNNSNNNKNKQKDSKSLFYIYNWEDDIINRFPKKYTHSSQLGIEEKYRNNHGIGNVIDEYNGIYDTHQYSLFQTFYYRLSESKYRTLKPNEALLYFIPYDIGLDCSIDHDNGGLTKTNCPMMSKVISLLTCNNNDDYDYDDNNINNNSPCYFKRNFGFDHFLLLSINQPMWHFVGKNNWDLYKLCYNCTKLAIDTYPKEIYTTLQENDFLVNNWFSIPFPSNYHNNNYTTRKSKLSWIQSHLNNHNRVYSLCFMGSLKVTSKIHKKLREILINECEIKKYDCLLVKLDSHNSQAISNVVSNKQNPYLKSILCLSPGGDFPSRKGILDAMFHGCIPVVFNKYTAHYQWAWFWNYKNINPDNCLIYIDRHHVINNASSVFDQLILMANDRNFIKSKLNCINSIRNVLQYNVPFNHVTDVDAVDVIISKLLDNKSLNK